MNGLVVALLALWLFGLGFFVIIGAVRGGHRHGALAYFHLTGWALSGIFEAVWRLAVLLLAQVGRAVEAVAHHFAVIVGFATLVVAAAAAYGAYCLYLYFSLFGAP